MGTSGAGPLDYWTPRAALPAPAPPPGRPLDPARERVDWLTMLVVVCLAAAMAFSIVIALAWVLGR